MMELSTAARVRDWVATETWKHGPDWQFSQKDIVRSFGPDVSTHQISAALSSMRKRGAIRAVGRLSGKGINATMRAIIYVRDDMSVLDRLPRSPPPAPHTRGCKNGFSSPRQTGLPLVSVNGANTDPPKPQLRLVDDLLMVSIALEESGPTREIGLRLLRVAERIFKEA